MAQGLSLARLLLVGILMIATVQPALSDVKPVSSDGEATVYLPGNFSGAFDLAYKATLAKMRENRGFSWLSVLLIGKAVPGPGVSVGLANGDPNGRTISAFTSVTDAALKNSYQSHHVSCLRGCIIELRGDALKVEAFVEGVAVGTWPRSMLHLEMPSVQLNAEVNRSGDAVVASLSPLRTVADGKNLPKPVCAFTTRGIEPHTKGELLTFTGINRKDTGEICVAEERQAW